jgi:hypothetical protein
VLGSADSVTGTTVNVSATGILIESDAVPEVGARVEVHLSIPGQAEMSGHARVARTDGDRFAVEFDRPGGMLAQALGRFVVDHNRTIIRSRRAHVGAAHGVDF